MQHSDIAAVFNRVFNGHPNFLTPHIVRYGKRGKMVFEVTSGEALGGGTCYGVTVIELPGDHRHDLGKSFDSLEGADAYVKNDFQLEAV